jgi:ABC-type multidrug transport system fused ATPase/permease subunit
MAPKLKGKTQSRLANLFHDIEEGTIMTSVLKAQAAAPSPNQSLHHWLVDDSGRLKMLHRDEHLVRESWKKRTDAKRHSMEADGRKAARQGTVYSMHKPHDHSAAHDGDVDPNAVSTTIEFDTPDIFEREDDGMLDIEISVRRVGNMEGSISFAWTIENGDFDPQHWSIGGEHGTGSFEPGAEFTTIRIPRERDPTWNADTFYYVLLANVTRGGPATSLSPAAVGRNARIRVFLINKERFPANVPEGASLVQLVRGFWIHNYTEIPRNTIIGIILAVYPGLDYFMSAMVFRSLVDCGIASAGKLKRVPECKTLWGINFEGSGPTMLIFLALLQVVLFELMHLREVRFRWLRLGGKATKALRTNATRMLLDISFEQNQQYDVGDIASIANSVVKEAIGDVWLASFEMITLLSETFFKWVIILSILGKTGWVVTVVLVSACPIMAIMAIVMMICLAQKYMTLAAAKVEMHESWFAFLTMAADCTPIINGYRQSRTTVASIDQAHGAINKANCALVDEEKWSIWMLRQGFTLVNAVVVITGGLVARQGSLTPGSFVVLVRTAIDFGNNLVKMGLLCQTVFGGAASVQKIATLMNRETRRKAFLRCPREHPQHRTSLSCHNVTYAYNGNAGVAVPPLSFTVQAGQLVCLPRSGPRSCASDVGINTLFSLMSGAFFPTSGEVCVPRRWRVIYVPVTPILFDGTVMYNLIYGYIGSYAAVTNSLGTVTPDDVWDMCRSIGMSAELIGNEDFDVGTNGEALKASDRLVISIVRALLFDTDVLFISSALDVLGEKQAMRVLKLLHDYVHTGGIPGHKYPHAPHLRHQKTILYTTKFATLANEDVCDSILLIPEAGVDAGDQDEGTHTEL